MCDHALNFQHNISTTRIEEINSGLSNIENSSEIGVAAAIAIPLSPGNDGLKQCSVCDFTSRKTANINRHLLKHNTQKRFACPYCNHRSRQKSDLQRHLAVHTGNKPFQCPDCPYSTIMKFRLDHHKKAYHD